MLMLMKFGWGVGIAAVVAVVLTMAVVAFNLATLDPVSVWAGAWMGVAFLVLVCGVVGAALEYGGRALRKAPTTAALLAVLLLGAVAAGCDTDARVASRNLSYAADNFEIMRRVVFLNGITDTYLLSIEGLCSIDDQRRQLEVTCETGPREYKKHFLGLSDNVTYFAEQMDGARVSTHHYRVVFKPQSILPDIDFRGDTTDLFENSSDGIR